jgi:hypothetical protein
MAALFPRRIVRIVVFAMTALAVLIGPALQHAGGAEDRGQLAAQCYNGVVPLNPYAQSCTLPSSQSPVRGAAPSANAIIACRHHPGCLAWYVNNPR